jgi:hypothetical protein
MKWVSAAALAALTVLVAQAAAAAELCFKPIAADVK